MKLNELMVGDWIINTIANEPRQIKTPSELNYVRIMKPIPITEEILVKNGFMKDGNGDYEINDGIVIVMDWKGKSEHFACAPYEVENYFGQYHYLYVELFECKYVHQLQHLLRLCGIEKEIEL